jgi:hypothetical protein
MIGLNSVSAGSPGSCWAGIGWGGVGSAAALGLNATAALHAMAAAAKPLNRFLVITTVSFPIVVGGVAG